MASVAILQNVDRCIRCNGCVIACKRTWKLIGDTSSDLPHLKMAKNQRVVVKPQKKVDTAPFVRYSCWHCTNPPCTARCPRGAIKQAPSGGVYIDKVLCTPDTPTPCNHVCQYDCQNGGYIRIGMGSSEYPTENKAQKCTMCTVDADGHGAGATGDLPSKNPYTGTKPDEIYLSPLKLDLEKHGVDTSAMGFESGAALADLAHQPACVCTCPAQAMFYDTQVNMQKYVRYCLGLPADDPLRICAAYGSGHMGWFSRMYAFTAPKADPFIEDHISPMVGNLLSSPFAKAALVPTLVAGGLLALSARRASIAEEQASLTGGEAR